MPGLLVLSGPSGAGKGTVVREVVAQVPDLLLSVSATTRTPRAGEVDGRDYLFTDRPGFEAAVAAGDVLEWAEYAGNLYGTPRREVEAALAAGRPVLLEIELQGARQVREATRGASYPVTLAFLAPPSLAELERRLRSRGTEDEATVQRRLEVARVEMAAAGEFDVVVVNHDVHVAAAEVAALLG